MYYHPILPCLRISQGRVLFKASLVLLSVVLYAPGARADGHIAGTVTASNQSVEGARIEIHNVDNDATTVVRTDKQGKYDSGPLATGNYQVTVSHRGFTSKLLTGEIKDSSQTVDVSLESPEEEPFEWRASAGAEQSQSASSERVWKFAGDLSISAPVLTPKVKLLVDLRVHSIPIQADFPVTKLGSNAASSLKALKVNEMAQTIDLLSGFELPALVFYDHRRVGGFNPRMIVEAGFTTPLNPRDSLHIYNNPDFGKTGTNGLVLSTADLKSLGLNGPLDNQNTKYIALTTPDRNRFFFQWYAGWRFKWYSSGRTAGNLSMPPYVDVTVGENVAITRDYCVCQPVWRMAGYWPVPPLNDLGIAVVGEFSMLFAKGHTGAPIFLDDTGVDTSVKVPNSAIAVGIPTSDRDFYRIGVQADIAQLIKHFAKTVKQ